ncbi:MAG: restriction endonuclease [Anaerolineae bacterium]|nr:restriction endonuclease [Anaerolineae bacterium]
MGRIINTVRYFRDSILEYVAYKSGLLLTDYNAKDLLSKDELERSPFSSDLDNAPGCAIRSEIVEEVIIKLRARLGNLPDELSAEGISIRWTQSALESGIDPEPIYDAFFEIKKTRQYLTVTPEIVEEICKTTNLPPAIIISFFKMMATRLDRNPWTDINTNCRQKLWDGSISLSELFDSEMLPSGNPQQYFDQRFINFLAQNPDTLDRIHWRNFEKLIAEFFERQDYEVELGPGSNDGGIDIRLWNSRKDESEPPLMLIQCKRYNRNQQVKIEYVKAFYADVDFEQAKHGLIVTTSQVAVGGHKVCKARGWPLTLVENEQVTEWVQSMWRYPVKLP